MGYCSTSGPNLWTDTFTSTNRNMTASTNISAGANICATGGLVNTKNIDGNTRADNICEDYSHE